MRETPHSLYDLRKSGGRNPLSQDLKFINSTRATCWYQKHAISSNIRVWRRKLQGQEVFAGLPWVVAHASRGREPSYSGLFSI